MIKLPLIYTQTHPPEIQPTLPDTRQRKHESGDKGQQRRIRNRRPRGDDVHPQHKHERDEDEALPDGDEHGEDLGEAGGGERDSGQGKNVTRKWIIAKI
jgi:hypothetical protein